MADMAVTMVTVIEPACALARIFRRLRQPRPFELYCLYESLSEQQQQQQQQQQQRLAIWRPIAKREMNISPVISLAFAFQLSLIFNRARLT